VCGDSDNLADVNTASTGAQGLTVLTLAVVSIVLGYRFALLLFTLYTT
jgi:hypothetical protein